VDALMSTNQVTDYIDYWKEDLNPAFALQNMQIQALEDLSKNEYIQFPHPYFWGSYTMYINHN
jgi:CHAT domain-containing protein